MDKAPPDIAYDQGCIALAQANWLLAKKLFAESLKKEESPEALENEELDIPEPDVNLGTGGGTQAEHTVKIMTGYEKLLMEELTDLIYFFGY